MKREIRTDRQPIVAALGVFDGVHLGHRQVLLQANALGACHVVTFAAETMPQKQNRIIRYLYDDRHKSSLLTECGAKAVYSLSFEEICGLEGAAFCRTILKERLQVDAVVCGEDFRFGRHAACDTNDLVRYGQRYGFDVALVPQYCLEGTMPVSSAHIRFLLESGEIQRANRLLGAEYRIEKIVTDGNHIGRTIGIPTANQVFEPRQCVPCFGVYASFVQMNDICVPAITNIGIRPTVTGDKTPIAETHLLHWNGALEGKWLSVTLTRFIRPEMRFPSLDALSAQIRKDITLREAMLS